MKRLVEYAIGTKNVGIEATINLSKGFVEFVDSDFANGRNKLYADITDNMFSRAEQNIYFLDSLSPGVVDSRL